MNRSVFTRFAHMIVQVGLLIAIWWACDAVVHLLRLPLSGGVLGLGVVLALLFSGVLRVDRVKVGAQLLLTEMILFFIPAVVAIVRYQDLLVQSGVKLMALIVIGNACVMFLTAFAVEAIVRRGGPDRGLPVAAREQPA
ncbi:CidA/LrgA family protein [Pigmentiphaga litoralis]|uniref:CidA/LrgA family protein n=1 Tax=Pigmentiphaga litoralis TaxID=516702 RepID=UPI003B432784